VARRSGLRRRSDFDVIGHLEAGRKPAEGAGRK
jgi:hypothetical protein